MYHPFSQDQGFLGNTAYSGSGEEKVQDDCGTFTRKQESAQEMMKTCQRDPRVSLKGLPISQMWVRLASKIIMMVMVVMTKESIVMLKKKKCKDEESR